jgi:GAF domain-containing protein
MGDESGRSTKRFDLRDLGLLSTVPDRDFDIAVMLAAGALRTPMATFAVLDIEAGVLRLRAHVGTKLPATTPAAIPIETSLSIRAMSGLDVIAIPDTSRDPIARAHPFVRAQGVQSVLGAPVMCPASQVAAIIAVHDHVPRIWSTEEKQVILGFAHFCTELILLRAALRTLGMVSRGGRAAG